MVTTNLSLYMKRCYCTYINEAPCITRTATTTYKYEFFAEIFVLLSLLHLQKLFFPLIMVMFAFPTQKPANLLWNRNVNIRKSNSISRTFVLPVIHCKQRLLPRA